MENKMTDQAAKVACKGAHERIKKFDYASRYEVHSDELNSLCTVFITEEQFLFSPIPSFNEQFELLIKVLDLLEKK